MSFSRVVIVSVSTLALTLVFACDGEPSKSAALEIITREVEEDASCLLGPSALAALRRQREADAACVAKDGFGAQATKSCVDALVSAGVTRVMPPSYMAEPPDEDARAEFARPRSYAFSTCIALSDPLRATPARFSCGAVRAERVLQIKGFEDRRVVVDYARTVTLDPKLGAIEAACGEATRPSREAWVPMERINGAWRVVPPRGAHH